MGNRRALARRTAFALLTLPALTSLTSIASRSAPPVVITGLQPVGLIESEIAVPSDATAPADQLPATIDSLPGAAVDGAAGGSSQAVRAVMQSLVRKDYQRALLTATARTRLSWMYGSSMDAPAIFTCTRPATRSGSDWPTPL